MTEITEQAENRFVKYNASHREERREYAKNRYTDPEYRAMKLAYTKQYREEHRDEILQKINCTVCGGSYRTKDKNRHEQSQKHIKIVKYHEIEKEVDNINEYKDKDKAKYAELCDEYEKKYADMLAKKTCQSKLVKCECGMYVGNGSMNRHKTSNKHLEYEKSKAGVEAK